VTFLTGRARYRRAFFGTVSNVLAKGAQGALALVSVPIALKAFDTERYGMWMVVSALLPVAGLIDQGVGYGLVQGLSERGTDARGERDSAYVSTYFYLTATTAVAVAVLLAASYLIVPWGAVLGVPVNLYSEAQATMAVFGLVFAANLIAGLSQKIHSSLQEHGLNSFVQAMGSVLSLVGILAAVEYAPSIPLLALAVMGGAFLASALAWAALLRRLPWACPRIRFFDGELAARGWRSAGAVVATGAVMSLFGASDVFIIAHAWSPRDVTQYSVPLRPYAVALNLFSMLPLVLWPAVREALARGERNWARSSMTVSLVLTTAGAIAFSIGFLFCGREFVLWWSRGQVEPSAGLLLALGAWLVASGAAAVVQAYLGAVGALRWQLRSSVALVFLCTAAKLILVPIHGAVAAPWVTATGLLAFFVIPGLRRAHRVLEPSAPDSPSRPDVS